MLITVKASRSLGGFAVIHGEENKAVFVTSDLVKDVFVECPRTFEGEDLAEE